jgi:small subunit ribosomal protein S18
MADQPRYVANYDEEDAEYFEEDTGFYPRGRPEGGPGGPGGRRGDTGGRFRPRRKVCSFCVDKAKEISYKDMDTLRRFVDDHAKILARRKTGTCARHQRRLAVAIKLARHLALLPFVARRTPYD